MTERRYISANVSSTPTSPTLCLIYERMTVHTRSTEFTYRTLIEEGMK